MKSSSRRNLSDPVAAGVDYRGVRVAYAFVHSLNGGADEP
jgi:hypothetical protein